MKNYIDLIILNKLHIKNCDCETSWIEIKLNNKNCAVGVIYGHPDPNFKTFSEELFSIFICLFLSRHEVHNTNIHTL